MSNFSRSLLIVVLVLIITVLQDYIYSQLKNTGFYLSESMLYNVFYIYFIPFTFLINQFIHKLSFKKPWAEFLSFTALGILISFLHIFLFAYIFTFISHLVFTQGHRFSHMLNTAFSNQFYIVLLWYIIYPFFQLSKFKLNTEKTSYHDKIKIKIGTEISTIETSKIQLISTEKPYTILHLNSEKVVDDKSLKDFEAILDPNIFVRVHRSFIVNKNFIKTMKSRNNGDYDVTVENGQNFRFSRHYRRNWNSLLR